MARNAAAGLLMLTACTDGGPAPRQVELAEDAPRYEVHAGFEHQPEIERVIDPGTQPRLELVEQPTEYGVCPYIVEHRGFPAISEDGTTLVHAWADGSASADGRDEQMQVRWLGPEQPRTTVIHAGTQARPHDGMSPDCERIAAQIRERVAAVNAELAQQVWRPLERLDAFYSSPGYKALGIPEDELFEALAGPERPVEVFYRNGHFIARIRGLRILQDTPIPEWRVPDNFCRTDAQIDAVEFDRASKLALVHYNHDSGGCLCDSDANFGRVELSDEVLAEIDQRPTEVFWSEVRSRR